MNNGMKTAIAGPTYKAARLVSGVIERHFIAQLAAAAERGESNLAPEPSKHTIETIIDTAFWASLRKEEGRSPKISIAFLPPRQSELPLAFEERLPFSVE